MKGFLGMNCVDFHYVGTGRKCSWDIVMRIFEGLLILDCGFIKVVSDEQDFLIFDKLNNIKK